MSEEWEGFTDEDLRRMKGSGSPARGRGRPPGNRTPRGRGGFSSSAASKPDTSRVSDVQFGIKADSSDHEQLPTWNEQKFDGRDVEGLPVAGVASKPVAVVSASSVSVVVANVVVNDSGSSATNKTELNVAADQGVTDTTKKIPDEIELSDDPSIQQAKLEELQRRQKEIEEQNKQKKAALQKTIHERFQRSQRETAVLKKVKGELSKLDNAVTSDVSILRDVIDEASREYTAAKRRYDAAEAEFVTAKLDLFKKSERKEMLTQHLYTIIQEAELRKAKRLEDLTKDLATVENDGGSDSMKGTDGLRTVNELSNSSIEGNKPNS